MDISTFGLDLKKESDGVWVDIDSSTSLLIARHGNPNYKRELRRLYKIHGLSIQHSPDSDLDDRLMAELLSKTILLGWKGWTLNDEDLVYSQEQAEEILKDPTFRPFRDFVIEQSQNLERFNIASTMEKSGN